jgi:hypothetical protein
MSPRLALLTLALAATALSSGCTMAKISGAGPRPLLLNNASGKFDVIKHFTVEKRVSFDYTNSAEMDQLVAEVLSQTNADAIINLKIAIKQTVGDYIFNSCTCNLANARTYAIEGDAIKFK